MKVHIIMKTPCAVDDGIHESIQLIDPCDFMEPKPDMDGFDRYKNEMEDKAESIAERYFRNGETVTIEMDTESEKCKLLEIQRGKK